MKYNHNILMKTENDNYVLVLNVLGPEEIDAQLKVRFCQQVTEKCNESSQIVAVEL